MRAVWALIKHSASAWNEINAPRLGAALAYYTMLSIAPMMVLSIAIAGMVFGRQAAEGRIVYQLQNLIGYEGGVAIQGLLQHTRQLSSGIAASAVGIVVLLWGASSVFAELRDSLDLVWCVKSTTGRGWLGLVKYRFFSFAMVLAIGFLMLVSLVASAAIAAVGKFVGGMLPIPEAVLQLANILLSFVAFTILFALLYKFVPEVLVEWRDVWIGAAVTSLLFSVGKSLIGLYLGKASVGSAYGAAGSLVVFLIWVYYSAQIFLLGAEFTHAFAERHGSRAAARAERPDTAPQPAERRIA
jgi:membrane protein